MSAWSQIVATHKRALIGAPPMERGKTEQPCRLCGHVLPVSAFYEKENKPMSVCKMCYRRRQQGHNRR